MEDNGLLFVSIIGFGTYFFWLFLHLVAEKRGVSLSDLAPYEQRNPIFLIVQAFYSCPNHSRNRCPKGCTKTRTRPGATNLRVEDTSTQSRLTHQRLKALSKSQAAKD